MSEFRCTAFKRNKIYLINVYRKDRKGINDHRQDNKYNGGKIERLSECHSTCCDGYLIYFNLGFFKINLNYAKKSDNF